MKKKQRTSKTKALSAAELDAMPDAGTDLSAHMDLAKATRPGRAVQRVNGDFPVDLLREIDQEARPRSRTAFGLGRHARGGRFWSIEQWPLFELSNRGRLGDSA